MITPEQAAEAVRQKKPLFRLRTYSDSAGTPVEFKPIAVAYDCRWIAIEKYASDGTPYEYQEFHDLYLTRADAMLADAERLEATASKCNRAAQTQRNAAQKLRGEVNR